MAGTDKQNSLLNHTIPNLAAGVSQQFTEARFETQVASMDNCIPSLARGLLRRNPLKDSKTLQAFANDFFTYTYDRGTGDEQYIIIIGDSDDWYIYNLNTGTLKGSGTDTYLTIPVGTKPIDAFRCVTIGDYTFVLNNTKVVTMDSTLAAQVTNLDLWSKYILYWIKKTSSVIVSQGSTAVTSGSTVDTDSGSLINGYTYTLNDGTSDFVITGTKETRPGETAVNQLTSNEIAAAMATSATLSNEGAFAYDTNTAKDWAYHDSFGNEASLLVYKTVTSSSLLPATIPVATDKIVKITGALSGELDDFWMRYNSTDDVWSETVAPDIPTRLDVDTMPHVFYRLATGSFIMDSYKNAAADGLSLTTSAWIDRVAGDETSIPDPSFVGKTINSMFFHKNRLGFTSFDSVVLSETGEYGNFFGTTVQSIPDDDPIDLLVATTDVTVLRHAVSTSASLILFSDDAQFVLGAVDGPLTPNSANISTISNYTYTNSADATAIGNKIYFVSESGGFSQVFAYKLSEGFQQTEAQALTSHIPSYIPVSVKQIAGHSVLGYSFFRSDAVDRNELFVLSSIAKGVEDIQNAFHKWTFDRDILGVHVINNVVYILFVDGTLSNISLEIPGDITATMYLDNGTTNFVSSVNLSEFLLKDTDGRGTTRGRTQLRTMQYTVTDDSFYKTILNSSLNTIDPLSTWLLKTGTWDDLGVWDDDEIWRDALPLYQREYVNDDRVTLLSNTKNLIITIANDDANPSKGFEIATVNVEAYFHQRSLRY